MKKELTAYAATRPKWDGADCCVRALAVALNVDYAQASVTFSAAGRVLKKGTTQDTSKKVYEDWLGMRPLEGVEMMRLADFVNLAQSGSYVVHKKGHAFAVVEGVVHDWENTTTENTRVRKAWRVTKEAKEKMAKLAELLA